MATGACGIDCTTCRLHLRGECSSCGPAKGQLAELKMQTQERLLGAPCPVLACARLNRINHCLADCESFPCENFENGPYPFSSGFLNMQRRRRDEMTKRESHRSDVLVAQEHWQKLRSRNRQDIVRASGAILNDNKSIELNLFHRRIRILPDQQSVEMERDGIWQRTEGFAALITVMYLISAKPAPLVGHWLTEKELSCRSFFRGIHQMPLGRLLERFGEDPQAFTTAAKKLNGSVTDDGGDSAVLLWAFPKVPVKLILWCRDEELPAAVTVLFDESIEKFLPADAIWALVHLLQEEMVAMAE